MNENDKNEIAELKKRNDILLEKLNILQLEYDELINYVAHVECEISFLESLNDMLENELDDNEGLYDDDDYY